MGALIASAVLVPASFLSGFFDPNPYDNVEVVDHGYNPDGTSYFIVANFIKNEECSFVDLGVFGSYLGQTKRLEWSDPTTDRSHDRLVGHQTLEISIAVGGTPFDQLEVRTRHLCDGEKVDRIFAIIQPLAEKPNK